jgi:urease accessory protein
MEGVALAGVIESPLGNLATFDSGSRAIERVPIASDDLARRILRLPTSLGELGVRLAGESRLRDGDVVYADASRVVAVEVLPDDVLVCAPATIAQALDLAHALGNRHLPVQIEGEALVVRYDRLIEELLLERHVRYAREARKLAVPFRHAHAPHAHA